MTKIKFRPPVSKAVGRISLLALATVMVLGLGVGAQAQAGPITSPSGVTQEMARARERPASLDSLAAGRARWAASGIEKLTMDMDAWRASRITLYVALVLFISAATIFILILQSDRRS